MLSSINTDYLQLYYVARLEEEEANVAYERAIKSFKQEQIDQVELELYWIEKSRASDRLKDLRMKVLGMNIGVAF